MNTTTVTFWKPALVICALPTGITVAIKPMPSASMKPAEAQRERRAA